MSSFLSLTWIHTWNLHMQCEIHWWHFTHTYCNTKVKRTVTQLCEHTMIALTFHDKNKKGFLVLTFIDCILHIHIYCNANLYMCMHMMCICIHASLCCCLVLKFIDCILHIHIISHLGGDGKMSSMMVHCFKRCVIKIIPSLTHTCTVSQYIYCLYTRICICTVYICTVLVHILFHKSEVSRNAPLRPSGLYMWHRDSLMVLYTYIYCKATVRRAVTHLCVLLGQLLDGANSFRLSAASRWIHAYICTCIHILQMCMHMMCICIHASLCCCGMGPTASGWA